MIAFLAGNPLQMSHATWWRHQMETFSALLAICAGKSPVPGEFPAHRPVTRSFDVFFICAWINRWVNNCHAIDLRRYHAHYDVIVMKCGSFWSALNVFALVVNYRNVYHKFITKGPSVLLWVNLRTIHCIFFILEWIMLTFLIAWRQRFIIYSLMGHSLLTLTTSIYHIYRNGVRYMPSLTGVKVIC